MKAGQAGRAGRFVNGTGFRDVAGAGSRDPLACAGQLALTLAAIVTVHGKNGFMIINRGGELTIPSDIR
jgi:hypothetical protein